MRQHYRRNYKREREEVKDTDQLILPFFKSEKILAFSDDESMLLTDTYVRIPTI